MLSSRSGPESVQRLLIENKRLRARVEHLTKVLGGILRVRDCQGVWGLAGSQEIKDARRVLGMRWEIPDAIQDIISKEYPNAFK
jgi:hypothetical protein